MLGSHHADVGCERDGAHGVDAGAQRSAVSREHQVAGRPAHMQVAAHFTAKEVEAARP
jgi:hypothetical protein